MMALQALLLFYLLIALEALDSVLGSSFCMER